MNKEELRGKFDKFKGKVREKLDQAKGYGEDKVAEAKSERSKIDDQSEGTE